MKPLSKEFLLSRGWCCFFNCINCPYEKSMIVRDLDGNQVKWKIKGSEVIQDIRPRSSLHLTARQIIKSKFPTQQCLEEVSVPIRKNKTLFFDFYLPLRRIVIEVHGEQHYTYNSFFHQNKQQFFIQKANDREKAEWCLINGIQYIVLKFDEINNWENIL